MKLSSKAQKRLFIFGSLVVILLAVLLYSRIKALVDSYVWVENANKVELKLERVLSYLKDAETAQRGFLLTRDSTFLRPYSGTEQRVRDEIRKIDTLIYNDQQQKNFDQLQLQIENQFTLLKQTLQQAPDSSGTLSWELYKTLVDSKASMDRIRQRIARMQYNERNALNIHETEKEYYVKLTPLSLLFLVFAMLAIIGFSYYGLTKQLQQTRKSADDLDHLNNELLLKNKQLENSVEELNSFNYIASHDLKEPLRKILFFTDIISGEDKKGNLSPQVKPYVEKIQTSSERMKALLDDLLIYAQASMMERRKELVDLNPLLATVTESLSERIKERSASVSYQYLPRIQAVPSQMHQLFENLISNSLKYSKATVPPVITIQSNIVSRKALPPAFETVYEQYHQILFSDNGIGFTQDNADKIFVLFQRLHQRNEFSGTGIGLTICKKIVQNHDGFITVESEVDKGTTFIIYLPAS